MPGSHAILAPSSAGRWLSCTPSARLEATFPDSSSQAAEEGSLAHKLGELLIRQATGKVTQRIYNKELTAIKKDKLYDSSMWEYATDYSTFVMERFAEIKAEYGRATLLIEQKLNLSKYAPESFGTTDIAIIANHYLEIIDLKYGKGVPVYAENNPQMKLYALGAIEELGFIYEDIETVCMTIYQPRIDNNSSFTISAEELHEWGETVVKPNAKLAFEGAGEFKAGDHCRFCRMAATCKTNAAYNLELAKYEFRKDNQLTDEEIADILTREKNFTTWLKTVTSYALSEAINNGKEWPGWKLVHGRSVRSYSDGQEEEIVKSVLALDPDLDEAELFNRKIISITDMEKLIGKEDFARVLEDKGLVIKPAGKLTLAVISDKRKAVNSLQEAIEEFSDSEDD